MSIWMKRSNKRPCWKCGQQVEHYKAYVVASKPGHAPRGRSVFGFWIHKGFAAGGYAMAPVKHYVERKDRFEECTGSGRPGDTAVNEGNKRHYRFRSRWRIT